LCCFRGEEKKEEKEKKKEDKKVSLTLDQIDSHISFFSGPSFLKKNILFLSSATSKNELFEPRKHTSTQPSTPLKHPEMNNCGSRGFKAAANGRVSSYSSSSSLVMRTFSPKISTPTSSIPKPFFSSFFFFFFFSSSSSSPSSSLICRSHDRQRNAPTEGNLSSGRPARNNPIEPPSKLARGDRGQGGSKLPPHVPKGELSYPLTETLLEAEQAAALASSSASTDLQFATTLVSSLGESASRRAAEVAAAAAADFETAFSRRKMAESNNGNNHNDFKHLKKTLTDAAEQRRGQLRTLRHALRGDVQALVVEGRASKDEAARADAAVEAAFRRAGAALEEAAVAAAERAAKLAG